MLIKFLNSIDIGCQPQWHLVFSSCFLGSFNSLYHVLFQSWKYQVFLILFDNDSTSDGPSSILILLGSLLTSTFNPVLNLMASNNLYLANSSHLFVILPGLMCSKFFNHSKYETVTPPAFNNISGNNIIPFDNKISSAAIVVGPNIMKKIKIFISIWYH